MKDESKWNVEDLTDVEIYTAIRYLEPQRRSADEQNDNKRVLVQVCVLVLLLGYIAFMLLHWR